MSLRCLSLWQPWASAIATEAKTVETRGRRTLHRGELAIHAAKRWTSDEKVMLDYACKNLGLELPGPYGRTREEGPPLPLGAVVCVATVVDCREMDEEWVAEQTDRERELGGWDVGRFGYVLEDVFALVEPVPLRGRQSMWTLSEADEALVRAQLPARVTA